MAKKWENIFTMKLTDNEKRDIAKYLKENKPLPEKYRFLLFDEAREVELLWNGKTNEVTNTVLPFQTIEHIDEPRSEQKISSQESLFDTSGRQIKGWTNKLIWGDNKLILSSLKNGPLRKEIEEQGGLKLIYIDPPFDVGADFSMKVEIGDEEFTKKPSVIEEIAYRDTWGKGADSFMSMIYERLKLMHELLTEDGSIYVHCDWRLNSYMRLILDEIFGKENYRNEIVWKRTYSTKAQSIGFGKTHELILFYAKSKKTKLIQLYQKPADDYADKYFNKTDEKGRKFQSLSLTQQGQGPARHFGDRLIEPPNGMHWIWGQERISKAFEEGRIFFTKNDFPRLKKYLEDWNEQGRPVDGLWVEDGVGPLNSWHGESLDYPTQKPESMLARIIQSSSNEGDLIADFFAGSGTTLAVAENLGRKWIGSDLGRFSVHTTRKRMIGIQRELKKQGKDFRAFEILNIGSYERANFISTTENLRDEEKRKQQEKKERQYAKLILSAYKAEPVDSYNHFVGKKHDRLVAIGPVDNPVTQEFVQKAIEECKENKITKFDVLGFDYEMGLDFSEMSKHGVDVQFKVIPREVFDKRAVEKDQVKFYDVAYIEVKPIIKGRSNKKELAIELTDFSVFYNQDSTSDVEDKLKSGSSKVVIENGQVIKIWKDKDTDIIEREVLTKKWTDWLDYWAVDFDFESKQEVIKVIDKETKKEKEAWTGNYIFENEWQSFRIKKDRKLELTSAFKEVPKGKIKVAIKVVDIFGNDTTKVIEIKI